MRKIVHALLLLFLLVFAQVGALVHEIGHQSSAVASRHADLPEHAGDRLCSLCLAFAQVSGMARPEVTVLAPVAFRHILHEGTLPAGASARSIRHRNRDPPLSV